MKNFLLVFLLMLSFGSSLVLAAPGRLGLELNPWGNIESVSFNTDNYQIGGNMDYYNSEDPSYRIRIFEVNIWGDIKNKIDNKSSWSYGLYVYSAFGQNENENITYDYQIVPYLKYNYALFDNLILSGYCGLASISYYASDLTSESKSIRVFSNRWSLTYLF